jgi:nucleoid-associated protein YgaU
MFENKENIDYTDDLIKAGQEPIIIKQKDSSDRKFIYSILILLVVLFIIALGVIGYLGTKFFGNSTPATQKVATATTTTASKSVLIKPNVESQSVKIAATPTNSMQNTTVEAQPKAATTQIANKNSSSEDVDIAELESIVNGANEQEKASNTVNSATPQQQPQNVKNTQNTQQAAANSGIQQAIGAAANAAGAKKLSQEEMAKIAKMVAAELAKAQAAKQKKAQAASSNTPTATQSSQNSEEASLVKSLQEASTDTLQAQQVDVNGVDSKQVKATNSKKVDTFNKVVVENKDNSNDEFAKLSSEIDNILAQDEVKQNKANQEITSQLQSVVKDRAKEMRFIIVKRGDTLSSLAYKAYGRASAYIKIYKANPDLVKNPNRIYVGMKLRVPVDEEYKGK